MKIGCTLWAFDLVQHLLLRKIKGAGRKKENASVFSLQSFTLRPTIPCYAVGQRNYGITY